MSHKARRLIYIYSAAAIAVLSVYACVSHMRLENYRLIAKYASQRAFEETAASVDELSRALEKSVYAADAGMCAQICGEIRAAAQAAESAMATLPFTTQELSQTAGFLGTADDYAAALSRCGGAPTDEQRGALRGLAERAGEFGTLLQELRGSINDGEVMIDRQERRLQNVGTDDGVTLSARLTDYESGFDMPDIPDYDGRYTAKRLTHEGELNEREMLSAAAEFVGAAPEELQREYAYAGEEGMCCYSAGTKYVFVTTGGVVGMTDSRLADGAELDAGQARSAAEKFLAAQGYDGLELSAESAEGAVAQFEYIRVDGASGAACLDNVLRISVALDTGEVYSFDASDWAGDEACDGEWLLSEDEARAKLPEGLTEEGCRRVIKASPGGQMIPCYEFVCTDGEKRVKIYFSAADGTQRDIVVEAAQTE